MSGGNAVTVNELPGGVCATPGVRAAGVPGGLKPSGGPDIAVVAADQQAAAAAVQTRNQVVAAPVTLTARHVADGRARAVLLNAGSANACTGPEGLALAEESTDTTARALGCEPTDVLTCSTGVIGAPIPRDPFLAGIDDAVAALSRDGHTDAARAIMTTDLFIKETAVEVADDAGAATVGGMVKGSGMISPALATMLCVITTDVQVQGPVLRSLLREVVDRTFGRISVDGCLSTNDAVVVLATGRSQHPPTLSTFKHGLETICGQLAEMVVRDGEGATRLIRVRVTSARSEDEAVAAGRAVGTSRLVQTAVAGGDPNWGRMMAALGAGPVAIDPNRVSLSLGGVTVCRFGAATSYDVGQAAAALRGDQVTVTVDLGAGDHEATFLASDLTKDYVAINAEYTT